MLMPMVKYYTHGFISKPWLLYAGPQREIFSGGTRIDAGPPKLREVQTNKSKIGLHSKLVLFFPQN